ncbi:cell division protein FtsZ, partial [Candidatus Woesearchaeota archaeon]|nr:cell division protein FtsZ [Candidatus Woesearchaeota archaeon]
MEFIVRNALKTQEEAQPQAEMRIGQANIRVIGCGGGGTNATNWLYKKGIQGAEVIAINTDKQHLDMVEAD